MTDKKFSNLATIPKSCHLWKQEKPEPQLDILKQYPPEMFSSMADDARRSLRKCSDCGQLYLYEMTEFIDMEDSEDPMYRTYIPVASEGDGDKLAPLEERELMKHTPQIRYSWPKGEDATIGWVKG